MPGTPRTNLPGELPDDLREFLRGRAGSVDIAPGTIDWIPGMPDLDLAFTAGGEGGVTINLSGLGGVIDIKIPLSAKDGQLIADTSGIPVPGDGAADSIADLNADLEDAGSRFSSVELKDGKLRLATEPIPPVPEATEDKGITDAMPEPPMPRPEPPLHVTYPIPDPVAVEPPRPEPPLHVTHPIPEPVGPLPDSVIPELSSEFDPFALDNREGGNVDESIDQEASANDRGVDDEPSGARRIPLPGRRWRGYRGAIVTGAVGLGVVGMFLFGGGDEVPEQTPDAAPPAAATEATPPAPATTDDEGSTDDVSNLFQAPELPLRATASLHWEPTRCEVLPGDSTQDLAPRPGMLGASLPIVHGVSGQLGEGTIELTGGGGGTTTRDGVSTRSTTEAELVSLDENGFTARIEMVEGPAGSDGEFEDPDTTTCSEGGLLTVELDSAHWSSWVSLPRLDEAALTLGQEPECSAEVVGDSIRVFFGTTLEGATVPPKVVSGGAEVRYREWISVPLQVANATMDPRQVIHLSSEGAVIEPPAELVAAYQNGGVYGGFDFTPAGAPDPGEDVELSLSLAYGIFSQFTYSVLCDWLP